MPGSEADAGGTGPLAGITAETLTPGQRAVLAAEPPPSVSERLAAVPERTTPEVVQAPVTEDVSAPVDLRPPINPRDLPFLTGQVPVPEDPEDSADDEDGSS